MLVIVSVSCPIASHGLGQPESYSMFDAHLGSSDVLREGGGSVPAKALSQAGAAADAASSFLVG
jgi:hypothetical protein